MGAARVRTARMAAHALALTAGLALGGCATTRMPPSPEPVLSGRLVVRVDPAAGEPGRSQGAGFELQGDEHQGRLRLLSPLGTQVALAEWGSEGVRLDDGHGTRHFADLPALAAETLGEPLPLQALWHWLAGRPWPGASHSARAHGFEQLGWSVDLSRWADAATVEARRLDPPGLSVRARIDRLP